MLGSTEIRNALKGSFLLAKRDPSGAQYFDTSIDGFWRSFSVIFLIAPLYFLYALHAYQISCEPSPLQISAVLNFRFFISNSLFLVADWLCIPIGMIFVFKFLQLWPKYIAFIMICNWVSLFLMLALMPVTFLYLTGTISGVAAATFDIISAGFIIYYSWYVAKVVLEATIMTTTLVVTFELVLSALVHGLLGKIFG